VSPPPISGTLVSRLFDRAGGATWDLTHEQFQASLETSLAHAFADRAPSTADVDHYLHSLHLEDLAIAAACAAGSGRAWDHFVLQYRPVLYRAADAIDPTGAARELADALYAELYGLDVRAGVRQSLFRYFHGRSSLATWLRAVLAQRFVDAKRSTRRLEPLPEAELEETRESAAFAVGTDPDAPRLAGLLRAALKAALSELPARDRLRMACYYAREMTLATIGRELGEHEATVSRHLAQTRREIRAGVERRLRDDHGLNAEAIELCWRSVLADTGDLDVGAMMDLSRKDRSPDRSEGKEGV
jgi:RNA polymerase sigma factor (sigma-70 family)